MKHASICVRRKESRRAPSAVCAEGDDLMKRPLGDEADPAGAETNTPTATKSNSSPSCLSWEHRERDQTKHRASYCEAGATTRGKSEARTSATARTNVAMPPIVRTTTVRQVRIGDAVAQDQELPFSIL